MAIISDFSFKNIKGETAVTLYDDFQNLSTALSDAIIAETEAREQNNNTLTADLNTINTKIDTISSIVSSATHFIGVFEELPISGNSGDICIVKANDSSSPVEYIYSEEHRWQEFGNENIFYTKADADLIHEQLTSLISSISSETLLSTDHEITSATNPLSINLNALQNANLISATSKTNDSYILSDKHLIVNNIIIGKPWSGSNNNGYEFKLSSTNGEFNIGNSTPNKDLVFETYNNSAYIKLNSNTIINNGKLISCLSDVDINKNDNTVATTKFVKTNISSTSAETLTQSKNYTDDLSIALTNEIDNLNTSLTSLISSTSAETLSEANTYSTNLISTYYYNENTRALDPDATGIKIKSDNAGITFYVDGGGGYLHISSTTFDNVEIPTDVTDIITNITTDILNNRNEITSLSNSLSGEIDNLSSTLSDYATISYVNNKVDELLQQLTSIIATI